VTAVLHAWWAWTVLASVQAAVLVPIIVAIERSLGTRIRPSVRGALWALVMLRLVTPPALATVVPVDVTDRLPATGVVVAATAPPGALAVVFAIWIAGALVSAALVCRRYRADRAFCKRGTGATTELDALADQAARRLGLRRRPRIVVHDAFAIPATIGVFDPIVVLPRALACSAPRQDLEYVFLHELAHIRRRDAVRAATSIAIQILYWFHPLVGVARRRLAELREIACDRAVVKVAASRDEYRRTLIRLAQPLVHPPAGLVAGAGLFARHSELLVRLELLASPRSPSRAGRAATLLLCAAAFTAMVVVDSSAAPRAAVEDGSPAGQLQGCLRLRYAVYAALAEAERTGQAAREPAQKGQ
jgi:beta-lactamase regulating signal transducer with metallopeptidase domain